MTSDPATPHNPENTSDNTSADSTNSVDSTDSAKTVVISRPVHSIADLGGGQRDHVGPAGVQDEDGHGNDSRGSVHVSVEQLTSNA